MNAKIDLQGHGVEGRYAGLSDPYGTLPYAKIVIQPVPFDLTSTYQKGSDRGPEALIEASRNMELYDIETNSRCYVNGIYTALPILAKSSEQMIELTYQASKNFLQQDKFVVTLGGEHSVSYGAVKAHGEFYKKLTVLQFDAHTDLQPSYEGNPWNHACVMARIKELSQIDKIVALGIRSMSEEELPYLDRKNTLFSHHIEASNAWMTGLLDRLNGPIYITFDLDVFDCSLMPSTGTPEPGGLDWAMTLNILRRIFAEKNVVGFDVVELLPRSCNPAPDYVAAKLVYKMLSYKFCKRGER
ncbi:MAG: agmatinase [Chlamydiales bacterium 38-26]|nr:agmatinase [Chlamydiales bacterium]OJV10954.1 MAG: agmatinase [Chlamydiales bacterium 38-26]